MTVDKYVYSDVLREYTYLSDVREYFIQKQLTFVWISFFTLV